MNGNPVMRIGKDNSELSVKKQNKNPAINMSQGTDVLYVSVYIIIYKKEDFFRRLFMVNYSSLCFRSFTYSFIPCCM